MEGIGLILAIISIIAAGIAIRAANIVKDCARNASAAAASARLSAEKEWGKYRLALEEKQSLGNSKAHQKEEQV